MALELWRPRLMRGPLRELEREMEEMFARLPGWPWGEREQIWAPAVDMVDREDEIVLQADLPGLDEKDIDVTVQDGTLTIRGERKEEKEETKENYYYAERRSGAFARRNGFSIRTIPSIPPAPTAVIDWLRLYVRPAGSASGFVNPVSRAVWYGLSTSIPADGATQTTPATSATASAASSARCSQRVPATNSTAASAAM